MSVSILALAAACRNRTAGAVEQERQSLIYTAIADVALRILVKLFQLGVAVALPLQLQSKGLVARPVRADTLIAPTTRERFNL